MDTLDGYILAPTMWPSIQQPEENHMVTTRNMTKNVMAKEAES